MTDRSKIIFGNRMKMSVQRKAEQGKRKFAGKYGDDSNADYSVKIMENPSLYPSLGVYDIRVNEGTSDLDFDTEKGIIVGNIRMGFGHYRISIAMASAAHAMGYTPYWMDLNSYPETTCTKVIGSQNKLYSMGSRLSQKSRLFNRLLWEPLNYEGFRQLSYNAGDQKNSELMAAVFRNIPKEIPVIGTHVWPAQAALHAGMKTVINAIPDNWPMALHLAEGSIHLIQTHQSYMGYRILNGMKKNEVLKPMPADSLVYTGHYIDHELVSNIESDCDRRIERKNNNKPMRFLLSIGGAGAQRKLFASVIRRLIPAISRKKAALYINVGDYMQVWEELCSQFRGLRRAAVTHFNDWKDTESFAASAIDGEVSGIHVFCHDNESVIFSMQTFVVKLASGLSAFAALICLQINNLSDAASTEAEQTVDLSQSVAQNSKIGLRMTMTVIPVIGLLIAFFWFRKKFILTDEKVEEISEQVRQIKENTGVKNNDPQT